MPDYKPCFPKCAHDSETVFIARPGHEASRGFRTGLCPQRILCSKCGELLYTGLELETPGEIIQRNGGHCPKCGKKLGFDTENLKIIHETPVPGPQFPRILFSTTTQPPAYYESLTYG